MRVLVIDDQEKILEYVEDILIDISPDIEVISRTSWSSVEPVLEKDAAFDLLRNRRLLETTAEHFLEVLKRGTVSTNVYLRRLHNYAIGMHWLPWPILAYAQWPRLKYKTRRAITADEAQRLLDVEKNEEWKAFLQLLWHIGAAQVDMAALTHENINWPNRTISYTRKKTGTLALQRFGAAAEAILRERPNIGPLFPYFGKQESAARATRFSDRCKKLGIVGVSLHSYRYAWAERARQAGYPERFARETLGHTSAAVHRAYPQRSGRFSGDRLTPLCVVLDGVSVLLNADLR